MKTITIELSDSAYSVLQAYCGATGITHDYFIDNWLLESKEPLERLVRLVDDAKAGRLTPEQVREELTKYDGILSLLDRVRI